MEVGTLGDIVFEAGTMNVLVPQNISADSRMRYEEHNVFGSFCIRKSRGEDLSDEEKTILCLPDIAEAMAEKQKSEKDRQGWLYLKSMFERWLGHKPRIGPSGTTPMWIDWDWLMQFERARTSYQSLTINNGPKVNSPHDVTNFAAFEVLGKILKEHGYITNQVERFDFTQIGWSEWGDFYHQGYPVDISLLSSVDGLDACMGGFTLRALAGGYVEPLSDGRPCIHMQKCAVYAYDSFQFENDGWIKEKLIGLGSWNCQDLDFSQNRFKGGSYKFLNNEAFRQFRRKNNTGGDFYVFTVLHEVENFGGKIYELSLCSQGHFPAACAVSAVSFCRPASLAGFSPGTYMDVLAGTPTIQPSFCTSLPGSWDYRIYFLGAVGSKTLSQNWRLADDHDVSSLLAQALFRPLSSCSPGRKGLNLFGGTHA